MKTKKYESIMNKAMKAAMNYENPDDQINEFIRFFGEHIGSERIYIFEDNIRKKVRGPDHDRPQNVKYIHTYFPLPFIHPLPFFVSGSLQMFSRYRSHLHCYCSILTLKHTFYNMDKG